MKSDLARFWKFIIPIALLASLPGCDAGRNENSAGHLIIIGGGSPRPPAAMRKFVELSGADKAKIAIFTMASELYLEQGRRYEEEFREWGVEKAQAFHIMDSLTANADSTVSCLAEYTGFYFGGGNQNRLIEILHNTRTLALFHDKYRKGAVFGGTSAGAAIMSQVMITGEGDWSVLVRDSVQVMDGFGFLKHVIIDQHFIQRSRFNRLLALVIQYQMYGIGIDQKTAIWVKPDLQVEVMGESVVVLLDPGKATYNHPAGNDLLSAKNLRLDIYRSGEQFYLR